MTKGKKLKKDTQRISLYRVRLEKDRDLMKERRAIGIAAPEEIVEVISRFLMEWTENSLWFCISI